MATLTIGDRKVTVGDAFLSMSPAEQQANVEEIAQSLGLQGPNTPQQEPQGAQEAPVAPNADRYQSPLPGAMTAFQSGAQQGMTANWGDELNAALMTPIQLGVDAFQGKPLDIGRSYNTALDMNRAEDRADQSLDPNAALAGNVTGAVLTGGTLANGGVTLMKNAAPTVASLAARGAGEGALYGAAYGAGGAEGEAADKLAGAGWGALWGALTGGGVGAVAGKIASSTINKTIPNDEQITQAVDLLYTSARRNGLTATNQQTQALRSQTQDFLRAEGLITPSGKIAEYPAVRHAMNLVDDYATGTMSVQQTQSVRNAFKDIVSSNTPAERRVGYELIKIFDDFTAQLSPELAQARTLASQMYKGRQIEDMIELARSNTNRYSQSGFENALRQEFRNLNRRIIRGTARGFSPQEIEAIREVSDGGTFANFFQRIGKWAPNSPISAMASGGLPTIMGAAAGAPMVGAGIGATMLGAGYGARQIATNLTANAANRAMAFMRAPNQRLLSQIPQNVSRVSNFAIPGLSSQSPTAKARIPSLLSKLM